MFENYKWNYDYARLACDTGFVFQSCKVENSDATNLALIDIDRLIRERDIETLEKFIPIVTEFVLDSDKAKILDETFVKTFRISQLLVEYLIFCKKYLDNTLVSVKVEIDKVQKENNELNVFIDDLKEHISILMKEPPMAAFKCELCNKVFSTDEFLISHKKRRHSTTPPDPETDRLHSEIKELKGRLNTAEKLMQRENTMNTKDETSLHILKEVELKKIDELQQRFEDLRVHVQAELKVLQAQHNFQEKYEKLLEKMTKEVPKIDLTYRRESQTQTDRLNEISTSQEEKKSATEDNDKAKKQLEEFGEALESKVSTSLAKIETQMQSFWQKLNEMETFRRPEPENFQPKPEIKPRSKYVLKNPEVMVRNSPVQSPRKIQKEPSPPPLQVEEEVESIHTDSNITSSEMSEAPLPMKPLPVVKQSPRKDKVDEELLDRFRDEIEKIVNSRLQELGVSPDWHSLPTKSYLRALEIVNHKANLIKRNCPKFDLILAQVEKDVAKKVQQLNHSKMQPHNNKQNKKVEIKNRKLYETDSESEVRRVHNKTPYSAVIEELKTKTTKFDTSDDSGSNKSEQIKKVSQVEEQTKGVLKNYPSVGSLTKKKVLFNLDERHRNLDSKDGGSSTSIASSVFDGTPRIEMKKEQKEIEDLSDFDFSDI